MRVITDALKVSGGNAPSTTTGNAHVLNTEFVKSHRNNEGWEFVRSISLAIGVVVLMFLLAITGILLAFGIVMWAL